jgi:glycolate oxidase FAD binding subunit
MARALGSPAEVATAAHVPSAAPDGRSLTAFRVQGFAASVTARCAMLERLLEPFGRTAILNDTEAATFWRDLTTLRALPAEQPLWRVNVAPSEGPAIAAAVELFGASWLFDWGGGLVWIAGAVEPCVVREAATLSGGHATLVRAPAAMRTAVPALHPAAPGVAALEARIRRAFDPQSVFETGRF